MSTLTCYQCNEDISDEEAQHWTPFYICKDCQMHNAVSKAIEQSQKEEMRLYWQLPTHWQARLRDMHLRR